MTPVRTKRSTDVPARSANPAGGGKTRRLVRFTALAVCAAAAAAVTFLLTQEGPPPEELLVQAKRHLAARRYAEAEQAAARVPAGSSLFGRACLTAGEAATKRGRSEDALKHYARIPADGSKESVVGLLATGEILVHRGDLAGAEKSYRRALDFDPDHPLANARLANVLGIQGRRWESRPYLLALIRLDVFTLEQLVFLGDLERMIELKEEEVEKQARGPRDPGALIGIARVAVNYNRPQKARELLGEVLEKQPRQVEALVRMGHLLLAPGSEGAFLRWHAGLPAEADEHPETWAVRGLWAQDHEQPRVAIRCMWEAVRRDPDHLLANHHLGRLLTQLGEPEKSRPFLERAERLREVSQLMNFVYTEGPAPLELRRAADLNESLGRLWEAWAWSRVALAHDPNAAWARERMGRLKPQLAADLPRTVAASNPALSVDLSGYPLPDWHAPSTEENSEGSTDEPGTEVVFADRAAEAGIGFRYFNDPKSSADLGGWRMYQFTGGGAAAVDFDGDYRPDLHLTQGCPWPPAEHPGSHFDRLYRNLGGKFADVTFAAGVADDAFSQGAAAGDADCDGFADLYVANVGRNRLYVNNGDGTFTDATDRAGIGGNWWTTSAVIVDLNGDALPEIFDANFLTGDDVYDLVCQGKDGTKRSCPPTHFPAAPDVIYLNRGDGTFEDSTETAGITAPDGNGLGVVAGDFAGTGKLDLFVANDSTPNFYFSNLTDRPGGPLAFREEAAARGCAVDRDGKAQACMGVAADDADGDGTVDLFVTNFYSESNTLYVNQANGLFVDDTRRAGLRESSLEMLGFGTQFLDGELDGRPDLVLTNGHVDDFSHKGTPYRMRPQYYRNFGEARFEEVRSPALGPFFSTEWLGRGLTKLDWNRDGLEDFVVSHLLDDPVALVTNETQEVGNHLAVHLRAVTGGRDAIGAMAVVSAGGQTWTKQLTAGDGYMASNERRLLFGLGEAEKVDSLEVRWLGGGVQRFEEIVAGSELLVIEGRSAPLALAEE